MIKQIEIRKCVYSGEEFVPKRNNQVFASKHNRICYHNKNSNKLRNELKSTNNQLLLNYKILVGVLAKKEQVTIHPEFLRGKGFDFRYFTNLASVKNQMVQSYLVYDLALKFTDDKLCLITRQ